MMTNQSVKLENEKTKRVKMYESKFLSDFALAQQLFLIFTGHIAGF